MGTSNRRAKTSSAAIVSALVRGRFTINLHFAGVADRLPSLARYEIGLAGVVKLIRRPGTEMAGERSDELARRRKHDRAAPARQEHILVMIVVDGLFTV